MLRRQVFAQHQCVDGRAVRADVIAPAPPGRDIALPGIERAGSGIVGGDFQKGGLGGAGAGPGFETGQKPGAVALTALLRRDGHSQLVYKHAISTVMPAAPVQLFEQGGVEEED